MPACWNGLQMCGRGGVDYVAVHVVRSEVEALLTYTWSLTNNNT
jgi:hypothetical protein